MVLTGLNTSCTDAESKLVKLFNSSSLIQLQVTLKNQNQEVFAISGDRGNQWISVERNIRLIAGERVSFYDYPYSYLRGR